MDLLAAKRMADGTLEGVPGRGLRVAPVPAPGRRRAQSPALLHDRARHLGAGAQGHGGRGRAVRRHQHLEDGQRPRGLPVRRVRGPVPQRLACGAEGARDVPAEQGARRGAVGRAAGAGGRSEAGPAGRGALGSEPAPVDQEPARAGARLARVAEPADAAVGEPGVDLHARAPGWRVRALRRPRRGRGRGGAPSVTTGRRAFPFEVVGERRGAAARPRRGGEDAVDGHAREGPRLAEAEARRAGEDRRATSRSSCRSRRTASASSCRASPPDSRR